MSVYKKLEKVTYECPAYKAVVNCKDHRGHRHLEYNDNVMYDGDLFSMGSVASYAIKSNHDPIEAIEQAKRNYHELHFATARGICLSASYTPQEMVIEINFTDVYRFEGLLFKFEPANNNNLALVQQPFPKGFY